jgi:group I intron endonuclease
MKNEELAYLVYKHTSPSGKAYIGQTKNYSKRCLQHRSPLNNNCASFSNAIKKYGWDNFHHEVLIDGLSLDDANTWEELLIAEHGTLSPNGYNLKTGGDNVKLSEETKAKMSKSQRESDKNPERNKKIAAFFSDPDLRRSISERQARINNTPEVKEKISKSKRKDWEVVGPSGEVLLISNMKQFCIDNNLNYTNMKDISRGRFYKGYHVKGAVNPKSIKENNSKDWLIISPSGELLTIHNMRKFCMDNGLNYGCMGNLKKGYSSQGYKLQ